MSYTIADAISYLRWEIEREVKRMKEAASPTKQHWLEGNIEWMFERGIELIKLAGRGEVDQELLDFFQGKIRERPDFTRLKKALEKKDHR